MGQKLPGVKCCTFSRLGKAALRRWHLREGRREWREVCCGRVWAAGAKQGTEAGGAWDVSGTLVDRGQDGVNRDDVDCVALVRILAFSDFEEKLLEAFEQSDTLCLVLKGSLGLPPSQGADQSGVACHRVAELTVAPARVLVVWRW